MSQEIDPNRPTRSSVQPKTRIVTLKHLVNKKTGEHVKVLQPNTAEARLSEMRARKARRGTNRRILTALATDGAGFHVGMSPPEQMIAEAGTPRQQTLNGGYGRRH